MVWAAAITRSPRRCACGAILIRRHIRMRSPGSLPTALTAKHLHGVAANFRFRLGWDVGIAHLVHPFKLQFPSAARASHHRDWHRLRRRSGGVAARRRTTAESSLPGFPPGALRLILLLPFGVLMRTGPLGFIRTPNGRRRIS